MVCLKGSFVAPSILLAVFLIEFGFCSENKSISNVEIYKTIFDKKLLTSEQPSEMAALQTNSVEQKKNSSILHNQNSIDISTRIKESIQGNTTAERNPPVHCRCGVFLTSQFKHGSSSQPKDDPIFIIDLDHKIPCNLGHRQCQTKCIQTLVSYLPNSGDMLCDTTDRDIYKERAYLFIQTCGKPWFNTNLAAGREYCCKNGASYPCPLL